MHGVQHWLLRFKILRQQHRADTVGDAKLDLCIDLLERIRYKAVIMSNKLNSRLEAFHKEQVRFRTSGSWHPSQCQTVLVSCRQTARHVELQWPAVGAVLY